jgi:hypothetical protein
MKLHNQKYLRHELLGTLVLTGNGINFTWRNLLRPNEMPRIRDHKLEDQVVYPAAGYFALAIEDISQMIDATTKRAFEFHNAHISAALMVPDENNTTATELEVHTTMSLRKISTANSSINWHDFSIWS